MPFNMQSKALTLPWLWVLFPIELNISISHTLLGGLDEGIYFPLATGLIKQNKAPLSSCVINI